MKVTEWNPYILDVITIAKEFLEETKYPVTFDSINTQRYIYDVLNDKNSALFLQYVDNEIAGGSIITLDNSFHKESFGAIIKFYVLPKYRNKNIGFRLLKEIDSWFKEKEVVGVFVNAAAMVGQDENFVRLFSKLGYTSNGVSIYKHMV